jgi:nicotinate-nucleotide pyrophosphorylase (carboxylating)
VSDYAAFAKLAVDEDLGPGDVTTESTVDPARTGDAVVLVKQDLVVCGHALAAAMFAEVGRRLSAPATYEILIPDGTVASRGQHIARARGSLRALLIAERPALNCLMKLSGIATHVKAYVDAAGPSGPRVVDTRKSTPLWRDFEKLAVRAGGGHNHRHALYDGVLIKDNHLIAAGGVTAAVKAAKAKAHHLLKVECEVTTLAQLEEALAAGADVLLLDNMDDAMLQAAVKRARELRPGVVLEASGNMTPERIARIRGFGVDLVSAGGLIHQARWVDLSLDFV